MLAFSHELKKNPIVFVIIPFILGIIISKFVSVTTSWVFFFSAFFLTSVFILNSFQSRSFRFAFIFFAFGASFFLGTFRVQIQNQQPKPNTEFFNSGHFRASIEELPYFKNEKCHVLLKINAFKTKNGWKACDFKCQATINDSNRIYRYNQSFIFKGNLFKPEKPLFSNQFDYSQYLYNQGIYALAYIQPGKIVFTGNPKSGIMTYLNVFRERLMLFFNSSDMDNREKSILSSFVIGYQNEIDPELKKAYATAGLSHILSVSGMHVGIVFAFISFLLGLLPKNNYFKFLKMLLLLSTIWFYAIISGLSAPVLRASFMFSFLALSELSSRKTMKINILALSAMILLLINPNVIYDVGFQLSYAAMLGIMLFYNPVSERYTPKNRILKEIYTMTLLTISAQLTTLPLILYYFQQFPTYFLLSNLVVVPLAGIIIYAAIIYTAFLPFPAIDQYFLIPLKYLLKGLNFMVLKVEELPGNLISNLHVGWFEITITTALISCFIILVVRKKLITIPICIACFLLLSLKNNIELTQADNYVISVQEFHNQSFVVVKNEKDIILLGNDKFPVNLLKNITFLSFNKPTLQWNSNELTITKKDNQHLFIKTNEIFVVVKINQHFTPEKLDFFNKDYQLIKEQKIS